MTDANKDVRLTTPATTTTDRTDRVVETTDSHRLDSDDVAHARDVRTEHHGDANRDPITGEPGSHPVGTGIGAAGAGAIGAAIGAVAGPIGALAGAAIGSVIGGLAGKGVAEAIDPTEEDSYWRESYATRPYVERDHSYDDYAPAYRLGTEAGLRHHAAATPETTASTIRSFDDLDTDLSREWEQKRGGSKLTWDKARHATRDAFDRTHGRLTNASTGTMSTGVIGRSSAATGAASTSSNTAGTSRSGYDVGASPSLSAGQPGTSGSTAGTSGQFGASSHMGSSSPSTSGAFDGDYFRNSFSTRPYSSSGHRYEDYEPAYRFGHESYGRHSGRSWDEVEPELGSSWQTSRGTSGLSWDHAKHAVKDVWEQMKTRS